jgi:CheY-like chemotaxis protein
MTMKRTSSLWRPSSSDLGCGLVRARSGNEALRCLLRHKFAVMLLDVQMPEMDGYEVARYARDNHHTREVPIIFLTAANQTEARCCAAMARERSTTC